MNWARSLLAVLLTTALVAGTWLAAEGQYGPTMPVSGVIVNGAGMPIGGLTVRLLHNQLGPSFPSITNPSGYYFIANVPMNVGTPYVIEVQWGQRIVFKDYVRRLGVQVPIRLR